MADYYVGKKEYFTKIGKIKYEGPKSDNPLLSSIIIPINS